MKKSFKNFETSKSQGKHSVVIEKSQNKFVKKGSSFKPYKTKFSTKNNKCQRNSYDSTDNWKRKLSCDIFGVSLFIASWSCFVWRRKIINMMHFFLKNSPNLELTTQLFRQFQRESLSNLQFSCSVILAGQQVPDDLLEVNSNKYWCYWKANGTSLYLNTGSIPTHSQKVFLSELLNTLSFH